MVKKKGKQWRDGGVLGEAESGVLGSVDSWTWAMNRGRR